MNCEREKNGCDAAAGKVIVSIIYRVLLYSIVSTDTFILSL